MSFDTGDIRPAMDVYTFDNVYLGTVLAVIAGQPDLKGEHTPEQAHPNDSFSGEQLGPMPTRELGNRGPVTQSAAQRFATARDEAASLGRGTIRVGKWWGLVGKRDVPFDAIQTVSLERVVLKRGVE